MSDQNTQFCFTPEEKPYCARKEERFSLFLKATVLCVLCVGFGVWFTSNKPTRNITSDREIQSVKDPALIWEVVDLEPFFVLLKSEQGTQLTKVEVSLQVSDTKVSEEIQNSIHQIKDHLVFILSNQNASIFDDIQKRQGLEQEIVTQLNVFLVSGSIENVQLNKFF